MSGIAASYRGPYLRELLPEPVRQLIEARAAR